MPRRCIEVVCNAFGGWPPECCADFAAIDVEMTSSRGSSICQIRIVGFRDKSNLRVRDATQSRYHFSGLNAGIHGITAERVAGQPCFADVHDIVHRALAGRTTVAHSCFDKSAIAAACRIYGRR